MKLKARFSTTIDMGLFEEVNNISKKEKVTKSSVVEEALKLWLKRQREKELEKAYREMRDEDQRLAELSIPAQAEVL